MSPQSKKDLIKNSSYIAVYKIVQNNFSLVKHPNGYGDWSVHGYTFRLHFISDLDFIFYNKFTPRKKNP